MGFHGPRDSKIPEQDLFTKSPHTPNTLLRYQSGVPETQSLRVVSRE